MPRRPTTTGARIALAVGLAADLVLLAILLLIIRACAPHALEFGEGETPAPPTIDHEATNV